MKESITEKFQRIMDHPGKRFLLWFPIFVVFFALTICLGNSDLYVLPFISVIIFLNAFFTAISFGTDVRTKYVESITLCSSDGKHIPCIVVKEKDHTHGVMFILSLFSLFFYVPYRVTYYLIKYTTVPDIRPGQRLSTEAIFHPGLHSMKKISKKEYLAIKSDPRRFADELCGETVNDRKSFLNTFKPFEETGLLSEDFFCEFFSVCYLEGQPDERLFFHYSGKEGEQVGFCITLDMAEKIRKNMLDPGSIITSSQIPYIGLVKLDEATLKQCVETKNEIDKSEEKLIS